MKKSLMASLLLSATLTTSFVYAEEHIVATIKPISLIATQIAGDHFKVETLLPDHASPHNYALLPSDLTKLKQAKLNIWVGPSMETFLIKMFSNTTNVLTLTAIEGMPLHHYEDDHHHGDGHEHHGDIDGHIWLGPEQSLKIAAAIRDQLIKIDPDNQTIYLKNYSQFEDDLRKTHSEISAKLSRHQSKDYYHFHDAYGYFENAFGLQATGHMTINPEQKPGAKTLFHIRKKLQQQRVHCIFSEPQFNQNNLKKLTQNTTTKIVVLDPMATKLDVKQHRYIDFLKSIERSYSSCFSSN